MVGPNDFVTGIVIFIGVAAILSLVFGGFAVIRILRGINNVLFGAPRPPQRPVVNVPPPVTRGVAQPRTFPTQTIAPPVSMKGVSVVGGLGGVPCQGPGCRQINPSDARFCRRCGHPISQVTAAAQRRVAMW